MINLSKRILLGVCIEIKNNNYGSMLQSYATQKMIKDYEIEFELIDYRKKITIMFVLKNILRVFNKVLWQDKINEGQKKLFIKKHPELRDDVKSRSAAFEKFRHEYFLAPIVTFHGFDELKKKSQKYCVFLSGSDQLWSPSGLSTNFYNLMFTKNEAIRISYASSFGVKQIPWYQRIRTKRYLDRIQFISCREKSGAEIVKQLTGREVNTVLDPTMLFNADEWNQMLPCNRIQEGKYIFSYILGTEQSYREEVLKLSKVLCLPIVSIHQYVNADLNFGDVSITNAGPAEFIDLIRNAEFICTDSFHGSVFSIIYHKKFVVFDRYSEKSSASKNTRIDNLCVGLGLNNRRFSGEIVKDMSGDIDYRTIDNTLEIMREKSRSYLENAFQNIK